MAAVTDQYKYLLNASIGHLGALQELLDSLMQEMEMMPDYEVQQALENYAKSLDYSVKAMQWIIRKAGLKVQVNAHG